MFFSSGDTRPHVCWPSWIKDGMKMWWGNWLRVPQVLQTCLYGCLCGKGQERESLNLSMQALYHTTSIHICSACWVVAISSTQSKSQDHTQASWVRAGQPRKRKLGETYEKKNTLMAGRYSKLCLIIQSFYCNNISLLEYIIPRHSHAEMSGWSKKKHDAFFSLPFFPLWRRVSQCNSGWLGTPLDHSDLNSQRLLPLPPKC